MTACFTLMAKPFAHFMLKLRPFLLIVFALVVSLLGGYLPYFTC